MLWTETWQAWLLFAVVAVLGVVFSVAFTKSAKGFYDILRASLLFFASASIVLNTNNGAILGTARHALVVFTLALLTSYILLTALQGGFSLRGNTFISEYSSGIHEYANVISVIMLGFVSLWVADRESFSWPHYIYFAILFFILIMSNSRGAYLALLMCFLYVAGHFVPMVKRVWWLVSTVILVAFLYFSFVHSGPEIFGYEIPYSFLERRRLFIGTLEATLQAPWFGYGLNTYKYIVEQLGWDSMFIMPHNIYLELIFSVGMIGTLGLLASFALFYRRGRPEWARMHAPILRFWSMFAQLLVIYVTFRGLTELRLGFKTWGAMAAALGLLVGLRLNKGQNQKPELPPADIGQNQQT